MSEYCDIIKHHNLLFSKSKKKKKHCQGTEQSTEPEDKMLITNIINEINDISAYSEDIKMIRKYKEQFYVYNFYTTIGKYKVTQQL